MRSILPLIISLLLLNSAYAHPGNTDSSWCHTCRTNCPSWGLSYGEYHCHGGGSSSSHSSTQTSVYTRKTCSDTYGYLAIDNFDWTCSCMSGYEFGKDVLGNTTCVRKKTCTDIYGYGAVDTGNSTCKCGSGYIWNSTMTACEIKNTFNTCEDTINSSYSYLSDACLCNTWYIWSSDLNKCVKPPSCSDIYWINSIEYGKDKCICSSGYVWNTDKTSCVPKLSDQDLCALSYGINSISFWSGKCSCKSWYTWSSDGNSCIMKPTTTLSKKCKAGYVLVRNMCVKKK